MNKGVLILTPFFSPNIGGVETHFDDLVSALDDANYKVYVQTYSPITTDGVEWKAKEKIGESIDIRRYKWFGKGLLHKIEDKPLLDFLYLTPYLLIRTFIFMLINNKKISIIHAQGFNAAFIGVLLSYFFSFKLVVSTHAIYEINKKSITTKFIKSILERCDKILCLSNASKKELIGFGIDKNKINRFRYWIDLDYFKPMDKAKAREEKKISNKFTVLFVGRLTKKKGVALLINIARKLNHIQFVFIGVGPLESMLITASKDNNNIKFLGKKKNKELVDYYNTADIFCIPSLYEEGYGRVVVEAVACGVPVVGSNKGGIKEALNDSVSILVDPEEANIELAILELHNDKDKLKKLSNNCYAYSRIFFSKDNLKQITNNYK